MRCKWCGRFIPSDTPVSTHKARGRKNGFLRWRRFYHRLCPECLPSSQVNLPWWKP